MTVGSVGLTGDFINAFAGDHSQPDSLDRLIDRLERGEFDLVAVGRALISNPDWAKHVRAGDHGALKDFRTEDLARL